MLITRMLVCSLLISLPLSSFGAVIGKVIKVRGEATILEPRSAKASKLFKNKDIKEDSSILTKKGSIVIIRFKDKTRMVIGPKSKVIVQHVGKQKQGIVSLLKGKIRASVSKNTKKNIKFVVKSKTAAMGVRGTTFQATFNPNNNVTSLLTFNGEVAIIKKNKITQRKKVSIKELKEKLTSKNAVLVKEGRYAGVTDNLLKATVPVKISPKQFVLLKYNESFGVEKNNVSKIVIAKEIKAIEKVYSKDVTTKDKESGTFDKKKNRYKPRSGGLVDLESGIYIPPAKNSIYDNETKIYKVTNEVGVVTAIGDYVAPKGLKLDAKVGFVTIDKDGKNEKSETVAKLKRLNQAIAGQIVKPKVRLKPTLDDLEEGSYDKYFKIE